MNRREFFKTVRDWVFPPKASEEFSFIKTELDKLVRGEIPDVHYVNPFGAVFLSNKTGNDLFTYIWISDKKRWYLISILRVSQSRSLAQWLENWNAG
jgi:hypothetical protein